MEWFKSLFSRKTPERVFVIPDMKVNISEPVISFVETFKTNPKRFKVKKLSSVVLGSSASITYRLEDKYNKLSWTFNAFKSYSLYCTYTFRIDHYPAFLTKEEADFIYDNLSPWFNSRLDVYKEKRSIKQREALKKVYCK